MRVINQVKGPDLRDYDPSLGGKSHLRVFDILNYQAALSRAASDNVPSLLLLDGTYKPVTQQQARLEATLLGHELSDSLTRAVHGDEVMVTGKIVGHDDIGYLASSERDHPLWDSLRELRVAIDITGKSHGANIPLGQILVYAEPARFTQPAKSGSGKVNIRTATIGSGHYEQFKPPTEYTAVAYLTWMMHNLKSPDERLANILRQFAEPFVSRRRLLGDLSGDSGNHHYSKMRHPPDRAEVVDAKAIEEATGLAVLPVKAYK